MGLETGGLMGGRGKRKQTEVGEGGEVRTGLRGAGGL